MEYMFLNYKIAYKIELGTMVGGGCKCVCIIATEEFRWCPRR